MASVCTQTILSIMFQFSKNPESIRVERMSSGPHGRIGEGQKDARSGDTGSAALVRTGSVDTETVFRSS